MGAATATQMKTSIGALQGYAPGGVSIEVGQIYTSSTFGTKLAAFLKRRPTATATRDICDGDIIRRVSLEPWSYGSGFPSYVKITSVEVLDAATEGRVYDLK